MPTRSPLVVSFVALAAWCTSATSQGLLTDARPGAAANAATPTNATILGTFGSIAVFAATDSVGGSRIWRTDSTDAGTYPIAEVLMMAGQTRGFAWNGALYFFGSASQYAAYGLWRTDGTRAGTTLIGENLYPVLGAKVFAAGPDGKLWFFASEPTTGNEVWRTDGTRAGTQLFSDFMPGTANGVSVFPQVGGPIEMCATSSFVFFPAQTPTSGGVRLWRSDGTLANTAQLSPGAGGIKGHAMESLGNLMVYAAEDASGGGSTLYRTDGTNLGTVQLMSPTFGVLNHAVVNNRYVFSMASSTIGTELFSTDGVSIQTIADINVGSGGSFPENLTVVGNTLYFTANQPTFGRELYRTNGSIFNWGLVADLSFALPSTNFGTLGAVGNELWFSTNVGGFGFEPWRSAGTAPTTAIIDNLAPGSADSSPRDYVTLGAGGLFVADAGGFTGRLYWSDGTAAGTRALLANAPLSSKPSNFTASRGLAFFTADDGGFGLEPWVSDGTPAGTVRLADTVPGPAGLVATKFVTFRDETWFVANGTLWRSRGTPATTTAAVTGLFLNDEIAATADRLFLARPFALLVSDGTQAGTTTVVTTTSWPAKLTAYGSRVLYISGSSAIEVWSSDGTAPGTVLGFSLTGSSATVFEVAADGQQAWVSSRISASTFPPSAFDAILRVDSLGAATALKTVLANSPFGGPSFRELTPFRGNCCFVDVNDGEPWTTNGTGAPTRIADVRPGTATSNPRELTAAGSLLYFVADDGVNGNELWRSDGTTAGTSVLDGNPGPAPTDVVGLFAPADGETLVFSRADAFGYEPWFTDGTNAGARLLDASPGERGSEPVFGAVAGTTLVFSADDGQNGREPWAVPLGSTAGVLARPHGVPCGHPGGSRPHAATDGLPRVGNLAFAFTVRDAAPLQLCAVFVGVGRTEIPTPAGCTLQIDQIGLPFTFTDGAGAARIACGIPNDPYFVGFSLAAQFVAIDPPAGPGLFTLSDALDVLLGR